MTWEIQVSGMSVCLHVNVSDYPLSLLVPITRHPWQQWSECLHSWRICVRARSRSFPRGRLSPTATHRHWGRGGGRSQSQFGLLQRPGVSRPRTAGGIGGWAPVRESCQCIISTITQLLHRLSPPLWNERQFSDFPIVLRITRRWSGNSETWSV